MITEKGVVAEEPHPFHLTLRKLSPEDAAVFNDYGSIRYERVASETLIQSAACHTNEDHDSQDDQVEYVEADRPR